MVVAAVLTVLLFLDYLIGRVEEYYNSPKYEIQVKHLIPYHEEPLNSKPFFRVSQEISIKNVGKQKGRGVTLQIIYLPTYAEEIRELTEFPDYFEIVQSPEKHCEKVKGQLVLICRYPEIAINDKIIIALVHNWPFEKLDDIPEYWGMTLYYFIEDDRGMIDTNIPRELQGDFIDHIYKDCC